MASDAVIYHKPRCSTSRKTLELLRDNAIETKVVEYLKTPPSRAESPASGRCPHSVREIL
jgi:arsenate reductase